MFIIILCYSLTALLAFSLAHNDLILKKGYSSGVISEEGFFFGLENCSFNKFNGTIGRL